MHYTSTRLAGSIKKHKARFLMADTNLAMPGVAAFLRSCGVDCTLLENHVELATTLDNRNMLSAVEDKTGNPHLLYDTCGIWALGPIGDYGCDSTSYWSHTLAGLCHRFPCTKGINTRGYSMAHKWRGMLPIVPMDDAHVTFLIETVDHINRITRLSPDILNYMDFYRKVLPNNLRASGFGPTNERARRGQGLGFGNMNHPGPAGF